MGLKLEVTDLTEIDELYHDTYKQVDGKYVLDIEGGVKSIEEFNKVYGSLEKERKDHKEAKDKLKAFGEITPETIAQQLQRISELEAATAGKIDDDKIEQIVQARLDNKIRPLEATRDQLSQKVKEYESLVAQFKAQEENRRMTDEFSSKIEASKIDPKFKKLVMYEMRDVFEFNGDKYLTKDNVPGLTPFLDIDVWLGQQQALNPHWWGESQGGGATGGKSTYSGTNPFKTDNRTEQSKMIVENRALAKKLAEAANHPIASKL